MRPVFFWKTLLQHRFENQTCAGDPSLRASQHDALEVIERRRIALHVALRGAKTKPGGAASQGLGNLIARENIGLLPGMHHVKFALSNQRLQGRAIVAEDVDEAAQPGVDKGTRRNGDPGGSGSRTTGRKSPWKKLGAATVTSKSGSRATSRTKARFMATQ